MIMLIDINEKRDKYLINDLKEMGIVLGAVPENTFEHDRLKEYAMYIRKEYKQCMK